MAESRDISIRALLERIKGGDREARAELFALLGDERRFGDVVHRMARKLLPGDHPARRLVDSHDIAQSALRTGLRHLSDFRGTSEGELYGWLRKIIRTKIHRARRKDQGADLEAVARNREAMRDGEGDAPLTAAVEKELTAKLLAAVSELPLDQRLVVELRLRGVNAPVIGRMLGLEPATVRKRESRAVHRLRGFFGDGSDEAE